MRLPRPTVMIFGSARLCQAGHWRTCLPARAISRRSSVREHRSEYSFTDGHRPLWCLNECGECKHEFVSQPAFLTAPVFDHVQNNCLTQLVRGGWVRVESLSTTRTTFGEAAFSAHLCASAALPLSRSGQTASTGRLNFRAVCCSCSDAAPALVALGAPIKIAGPSGEKMIPLEKFFILPSVDYERENILTGARS